MEHASTLNLVNPGFALEKSEAGAHYTLSFKHETLAACVTLSEPAMQALLLQMQALVKSPEIKLSTAEIEASFRQPAAILRHLDDHEWQALLRELQSDSLVAALWYLKDEAIAQAAFRNLSARAAEMLLEDLEACSLGRDPDTLPEHRLIPLRQALQEVLATVARLQNEGSVL